MSAATSPSEVGMAKGSSTPAAIHHLRSSSHVFIVGLLWNAFSLLQPFAKSVRHVAVFAGIMLSGPVWAAWTFDATGTAAIADNAAISPAWPTHETGDVGLVFLCHRAVNSANGRAIGTPAGYTLIDSFHNGDTLEDSVYLFGKVAASAAEPAPTFTPTGGTAEDVLIGVVTVWEGGTLTLSGTPVDTNNGTADLTIEYGTFTPADDASLVLINPCHRNGAATSASTDPSGFTAIGTYGTGTGDNGILAPKYQIQTTATEITAGAITVNNTTSRASFSTILALQSATADGEFDTSPAITAQSTSAYTVEGSLDGAGDVAAVACAKDSTAPTISQVEAGDCTGDANAKAADSDSPAAGGFDFSLTLAPSDSPDFPLYDVYVTDGTNLTTLADEFLDPPVTCGEDSDEQCQFIGITSIGSGSACEVFNTHANPDIANADVLVVPVTVQPNGEALDVSAACGFVYSGSLDRQTALNVAIYDASASGYHAVFMDVWVNNRNPVCEDDSENIRVGAVYSRDLNLYCEDDDDAPGDLTYTEDTDPMITGLSFSDPEVSGTPTVLAEMGTGEYTVADVPGDEDELELNFVVIAIDGALTSTFIAGAVPATAVYVRGTAFTPEGARYVADCITPDVFVQGVGHTSDGATCINPDGDIANDIAGWPVTSIGEVVAAICDPEFFVAGIPRDILGPVCMTDIN
jgi:hypothetical protein